MRAHHVVVDHDFATPVDRIFAHLAEHENREPLLGARIERLADGADGHRDGVGSRRRLTIGPLPAFEETVTAFVPGERIEYRITRGSPLRDHLGVMTFAPAPGGGTRWHYDIRLASPVPGVAGIVKLALTRSIRASLPGVDAAA